jgi:hypothetical protein
MKHILARASGLILLLSMILTPLAAGATVAPDLSLESFSVSTDYYNLSSNGQPMAIVPTFFVLKGKYLNADSNAIVTDIAPFIDISKSLPDFMPISYLETDEAYKELPARDSFSLVYFGLFTKPGIKHLTFAIDSNNKLIESNEANNTLELDLTVQEKNLGEQAIPINNLASSKPTRDSVLISWDTPVQASGEVVYWVNKPDAVAEAYSPLIDYEATSKAVLLPDLSPDTEYNYIVTVGSYTGSYGISDIHTFKTNSQESAPIPPEEKILFSDIKVAEESGSTIFSWTTSLPVQTSITYQKSAENCSSPEDCKSHTLTISGAPTTDHVIRLYLEGEKTYHYNFNGQLDASKPIQKSDSMTLTTKDFQSTFPQPIKVLDPTVTDITDNSAIVSWKTNKAAVNNFRLPGACGVSKTDPSLYSDCLQTDSVAATDHKVFLKDLESDMIYNYYIYDAKNSYLDFHGSFTTLAKGASIQKNMNNSDREKLRGSTLAREKNRLSKIDTSLVNKLRGRLLLQTEEKGEAWYLDPVSGRRFYMQDGVGAYEALRSFGLGISNKDLEQIPVGVLWDDALKGDVDSDHDGLADKLESALGTDPYNTDSDNDSYTDGQEIRNGYSPLGSPKVKVNAALVKKLAGRILLQALETGSIPVTRSRPM